MINYINNKNEYFVKNIFKLEGEIDLIKIENCFKNLIKNIKIENCFKILIKTNIIFITVFIF
jgi:hypothetical protein